MQRIKKLVLLLVMVTGLQACEEFGTKEEQPDAVIEAVKRDIKSNQWTKESNKDFIGFLAGLYGHVEWRKFQPVGDNKFGPDIWVVEVTVSKKDLSGQSHDLNMQILYNTTSEVAQWGYCYVEIDGVQQKDIIEWITFFRALGTEIEKGNK